MHGLDARSARNLLDMAIWRTVLGALAGARSDGSAYDDRGKRRWSKLAKGEKVGKEKELTTNTPVCSGRRKKNEVAGSCRRRSVTEA